MTEVMAKVLGHCDILTSGLSRSSVGIYYHIRQTGPARTLLGPCKSVVKHDVCVTVLERMFVMGYELRTDCTYTSFVWIRFCCRF
jgi:hypothetical protein